MKYLLCVVVAVSLFVGTALASCSASYSGDVIATGDWAAANWNAAYAAGKMTQGADCNYYVTVSGLAANYQGNWKVTIGDSWTTNYGCQSNGQPGSTANPNGSNCIFYASSSGIAVFAINPSTNIMFTPASNPNGSPTPTPTTTTTTTKAPTTTTTTTTTKSPTTTTTTTKSATTTTTTTTKAPTTTTTTTSSAPTPVPNPNNRFVFAHLIIGNTYSWTQARFQSEITTAKGAAIDGFALNVGNDAWTWTQVGYAYAAANVVGAFKLFISFDMTTGISDPNAIQSNIATYASNAAQFKYNSKVFVSTFAGDFVTLGSSSANNAWQSIKTNLANQGIQMYFIPDWNSQDANTVFTNNPVMDGIFSWEAWTGPTDAESVLTSSDNLYISKANPLGKTYMAPLSPWFYTHIQAYNKNYLYKAEFLYIDRWEALVATSPAPNFIEIITWNDWGESHYIGDPEPDVGDVPTQAQLYSNSNFPHSAFRAILPYYIQFFKTGVRPTPTKDIVIFWFRSHPAAATASGDSYARPGVANTDTSISSYTPAQVLSDSVFVFAILTSPGTITITTGGNTATFNGVAGINKFSTGFAVGTQAVHLTRNSATVCSATAPTAIVSTPTTYNYNVYVGQCA